MVCHSVPPSEPLRVFISYAHKDGAALAQRLQSDLAKQGFDAWLDTERIAGGAVWSTEIEREIDTRQVTLALLSLGSYESEIRFSMDRPMYADFILDSITAGGAFDRERVRIGPGRDVGCARHGLRLQPP